MVSRHLITNEKNEKKNRNNGGRTNSHSRRIRANILSGLPKIRRVFNHDPSRRSCPRPNRIRSPLAFKRQSARHKNRRRTTSHLPLLALFTGCVFLVFSGKKLSSIGALKTILTSAAEKRRVNRVEDNNFKISGSAFFSLPHSGDCRFFHGYWDRQNRHGKVSAQKSFELRLKLKETYHEKNQINIR